MLVLERLDTPALRDGELSAPLEDAPAAFIRLLAAEERGETAAGGEGAAGCGAR